MKKLITFFLYSLRGRMIAGVVLVHAVLMGLVVADMVSRQQAFMERQVARQGQSVATTLAVNAPSWLLSDDYTALEELVKSLKAIPHLQLAMIIDSRGRVHASTDPQLFNLVLDDPVSLRMIATRQQVWHDDMVDSIAEITANGHSIGFARVLLNSSAVQADLRAVTRKGEIYTVLAILVGGLLAWIMVRTMTQRLKVLSGAADKIAGGELDIAFPDARGRDEVARLTRDFSKMARALKEDKEERQRFEALLFAEKERALVTLQSIGDAVITTDTLGFVEFLNPVAEQLTGWTTQEAKGMALPEVFHIVNEMTRAEIDNPVEKALRRNGVVGLANHTLLIHRDGHEFSIEDTAAPIRDREGTIIGVVLVFHDVTNARRLSQEISYQASHDALTGLFNRREFEHRLHTLIVGAVEDHRQHALLYLDLDQFKVVNDTSGHSSGDELLRQLTFIMQAKIREADMLARLGGDEFGVLLENCPLEQALRVAEELIESVRNFHFCWGDKTFTIGASVGLVVISDESEGWATSLSNADTACYIAKEKGRNRVQVYHDHDADLARRHNEMHWVGRITKAFDDERFLLYYQPIVLASADSVEPVHFEVLVRMIDEEGRLVTPDVFIPAAERYNLMTMLDRWVVSNTLSWLAGYRETPMVCAINLSGHSIGDERFLDFVVERIKGAGVPSCNICFEITETAAIANLSKAIHFIRELKLLGCRFSLDDFGSGLSSFAYLKNLPVDYLKIDGGFVRDMDHNETNCAMVEAINNIGHTMKILTIAEFVESQAVLDKLAAIGVDYVQGYGIAHPAPLSELRIGM